MKQPRLMDEVRRIMRLHHYSLRTEQAYSDWIKRFIRFHRNRNPRDLGEVEVSAFLSYLATDRLVAASTQNQALSAILFLYNRVLQIELPWLDDVTRAKRPERLPFVVAREDVASVFAVMRGCNRLVSELLYGSGMRLTEGLRLRVQDIDFDYRQIRVRSGKGAKDRVTVLSERLILALRSQLEVARRFYDADMRAGLDGVSNLEFRARPRDSRYHAGRTCRPSSLHRRARRRLPAQR